jgi:hypothetical protein
MAWAGFAKCLGARTVVSYESERGEKRGKAEGEKRD